MSESVPLTPLDLRALRAADTIHFYYELPSYITAMHRTKTQRDPKPVEEFHYIQVASQIKTHLPNTAFVSAFHMILNTWKHEPWQTVCHLLRPGDLIEVVFAADAGTNDHLIKQDLHGDHLYLQVRRGQRKMVFLLAERVSPNDSTRMVSA